MRASGRAVWWWAFFLLGGCASPAAGNPGDDDDLDASQAGAIPCVVDGDCQAARQVCLSGAGYCVDCRSGGDCAGGEICLGQTCREMKSCRSSKDCPGQVCDLSSQYCVDCLAAADCTAEQRCQERACVAVTACASSKQCAGQVCDHELGYCVDCVTADDCVNGSCVAEACVSLRECRIDAECPGQKCHPSEKYCVGCLTAADCLAALKCDPVTWSCQEEVTVCTPTCAAQECGDDGCGGACGECPETKYCHFGGCVDRECFPDCSGRECGDDGCGGNCGGCPDGRTCESGRCQETASFCMANADCPRELPLCGPTLTCQPAAAGACFLQSDCAGDPQRPVCVPEANFCVQCDYTVDCPEGEYCEQERYVCLPSAAACQTDADCRSPSATKCLLAARQCVECLDDSQCQGGLACLAGNACGTE